MATGKVKWFNDDMGFGFVMPNNGHEKLFVHHSEISMSGFKLLKKDQKVAFRVTQIPGGMEASRIHVLRK